MMNEGFVVKYRVSWLRQEKTTEVYPTKAIAQFHADDIGTYDGVEYAVVEPAPMRKS
jgi:hypothetical protein